MAHLAYEIIVVDDDSPDLSWQVVEDIGRTDSRVRCLRRIDAKGLSSAVMAGMHEASGGVIVVMDADLQHDESIIPEMYDSVANQKNDVCVGSREAAGGGYGDWSAGRKFVSFSAKSMANYALGSATTDPMSGFFAISSDYYAATCEKVNPAGFKIMLEFIARGSSPKIDEIGYVFRNRIHGETKLSAAIAVEYILALIDLRFGWLIPNRFVKFGMVGASGSVVNFCGFALCQSLGLGMGLSVFIGVELAILWTYFANNIFTFSPFRYRGSAFFKGLGVYQLMSCYGLVVQLSIVDSILYNWPFFADSIWLLYLAYMVGVLFAAIGNYFIHTYYTWNRLGFNLYRPKRKLSEI